MKHLLKFCFLLCILLLPIYSAWSLSPDILCASKDLSTIKIKKSNKPADSVKKEQRYLLLSELLMSIIHDINNELSPVLGWAQNMQADMAENKAVPISKSAKTHVRLIVKTINRARQRQREFLFYMRNRDCNIDDLIFVKKKIVNRFGKKGIWQLEKVSFDGKKIILGMLFRDIIHDTRIILYEVNRKIKALEKEDQACLSGFHTQCIKQIKDSVSRCLKIITNTLKLANGNDQKKKLVRLAGENSVLGASVSLMKTYFKHRHIELIYDNVLTIGVLGNCSSLVRVFVNLLLNAAQVLEGRDKREIEIHHTIEGENVRTSVKDSGPGIAPDIIDRIFAPYVSTKEQGTGLGLATCKRIILEEHNGQIEAKNHNSGGAEFIVMLPLNKQFKIKMSA